MPTADCGAGKASNTRETGLLDLSGLSLDELSRLDDSVVAHILRDLVQRRRCGAESREYYSLFDSSI